MRARVCVRARRRACVRNVYVYGNVYRLKLVRLERIGFCFFFAHERIKLVSVHLFLFLGFYGFGLGLGFGLLRIEKSRPPLSLSLSFERAKVRGSFSTPSNECKRVHATTDRPTDAGKRRERCSLRARENDAKNLLRKITTRENLPLWEREQIETKTRKQKYLTLMMMRKPHAVGVILRVRVRTQ